MFIFLRCFSATLIYFITFHSFQNSLVFLLCLLLGYAVVYRTDLLGLLLALLLTSLVAFVSAFSFVLRSINFWESMRFLGFSAFYNGLASYTAGIVIDTWLDVLFFFCF